MFNKIETVFVSKYLEDNTSKIYNFKKDLLYLIFYQVYIRILNLKKI